MSFFLFYFFNILKYLENCFFIKINENKTILFFTLSYTNIMTDYFE